MQCYTVFFIIVNALHVSGGFSAHHRELKNCAHSIGYLSSLLAATASGKICNKNLCCIQLTFYFHILMTMHGQNHIKFTIKQIINHSHNTPERSNKLPKCTAHSVVRKKCFISNLKKYLIDTACYSIEKHMIS